MQGPHLACRCATALDGTRDREIVVIDLRCLRLLVAAACGRMLPRAVGLDINAWPVCEVCDGTGEPCGRPLERSTSPSLPIPAPESNQALGGAGRRQPSARPHFVGQNVVGQNAMSEPKRSRMSERSNLRESFDQKLFDINSAKSSGKVRSKKDNAARCTANTGVGVDSDGVSNCGVRSCLSLLGCGKLRRGAIFSTNKPHSDDPGVRCRC